jgi:hypothetical protein
VALTTWLQFARIGCGLIFRRITGEGRKFRANRLRDRQFARLVTAAALAAGVRPDLTEAGRREKIAGRSLRVGVSSFEAEERAIQKQ